MLQARQAFAPVAQPGYRTHLYVPFEELVGGRHESLLRESADVGVDRSSQGLAQVVRIATRWHAGHAWAMGTAARARRAARRRREGLTGT